MGRTFRTVWYLGANKYYDRPFEGGAPPQLSQPDYEVVITAAFTVGMGDGEREKRYFSIRAAAQLRPSTSDEERTIRASHAMSTAEGERADSVSTSSISASIGGIGRLVSNNTPD